MSGKKVILTGGAKRVYDFMKANKSITSLQAFKELGETRLSARIFEIKKQCDVKREWVSVKNRRGETCHVVKYSL